VSGIPFFVFFHTFYRGPRILIFVPLATINPGGALVHELVAYKQRRVEGAEKGEGRRRASG
jgi:hypothetical protein